ncbi:MAG: ABC transporter permease [Desulfohalobiaceae bacterium]|nr:ABC transporter permease [Desulfohalobiaceae bacterium]
MSESTTSLQDQGRLSLERNAEQIVTLIFSGTWSFALELPGPREVWSEISAGNRLPQTIAFDCRRLAGWNSGLLTFLVQIREKCVQSGINLDTSGLPPEVKRLLSLAAAGHQARASGRDAGPRSLFFKLGQQTIQVGHSVLSFTSFLGETLLAFSTLLRGRIRFRGLEFFRLLHECGDQALPIVSLISLLVGLILAFVGAVQLKAFGAQIYVADLVGIAMVREMGAIMTGIIMAGRTGAAFAAHIGTMNVNDEIDALRTMSISPVEFLILPRLLVLILMMPLLCLYANLLGILGGGIVGVGMLDITPARYLAQTQSAVTLTSLWLGLIKSVVFGIIVALAGCYRGLNSGRNAAAVGMAATSAVVTAIVAIIVVDGLFAVICDILGI